MTVRIHSDHAVLREALAGTSKARLAYAPDWMLNLTARPLLRQIAGQIEQGQAVGDPMHGFQSQADWEASLPPDKQRQMQEWRQYDASRPMTDPDADAKRVHERRQVSYASRRRSSRATRRLRSQTSHL